MPPAKDASVKIEALRDKIRHHEYRYYVLDQPEISDLDFDKLMHQLKDLEMENPSLITPDSPTQRVGGKPREGFVKVRHSSPMLSLDNTYSEDELRAWERRVHELTGRSDVDYVCELKLDGMSLALTYEGGQLAPRRHPRRRHHWRRRHAQRPHGTFGPIVNCQTAIEESGYPGKFRSPRRASHADRLFQEDE